LEAHGNPALKLFLRTVAVKPAGDCTEANDGVRHNKRREIQQRKDRPEGLAAVGWVYVIGNM
jgi:hypothetical protein